jgi:thymidylate synthase ThyX
MNISAKILADSISMCGHRITTLVIEFPRVILPEFLTHRMFSKNTSSSRAIPIEKMIQKVIDEPFIPVHWGKNQKGMAAREELTGDKLVEAKLAWIRARDRAIDSARELHAAGMHKQICNRVIEGFTYTKMIVTATEFNNFFKLRCHEDAQPEIRVLAETMRDAIHNSVPVVRDHNASDWSGWHLPFVTPEELEDTSQYNRFRNLVRSVARCARVSYDRVEGGASDFENDLRIFKQLCGEVPHFSPFEHQAYPTKDTDNYFNLVGWRSLRYDLEQDRTYFQKIIDAC